MKFKLSFLICLLISKSLLAQNPTSTKHRTDTLRLFEAFKTGTISGQFRYYFMATDNQKELSDYYANAFGGKVKFETAIFRGFQLGITQSFTLNLGSSDFSQKDPLTGAPNRYEAALFDVTNTSNKFNLTRLDELYLSYSYKKSKITVGDKYLNTPFLNTQDGRMIPTSFSGLWIDTKLKNSIISGGWIYAVAPRGTQSWYSVEHSLGLFSNGVTTTGKKANYFNNIHSKGIGMVGASSKLGANLTVSLWDFYVDNVFNTTIVQADYLKSKSWFASAQFIRQDAINYGGNVDQQKTFIEKGAKAMTSGLRVGRYLGNFTVSLNYNYIFNQGRFLLPREWGKEPFFTFMPRERSEGMGNTHALVLKTEYENKAVGFNAKLFTGAVFTPDIKNYRLNKYGLSSYYQTNLELKYVPQKKMRNLEIGLLISTKISIGNTYNDLKNIINKTNLMHYNLVFNYNF